MLRERAFLCVCVTARRRGFRGGPFASGLRETSFDLFWAPFRHRFRGGRGIGVGFLFPLCCAFRLVPALRRGPFASGLRETSFDLFRAPSRHRFRGGGGIGVGFLFPLCCAFRLVPALRRGPFASGLRETSFNLFWAPSRYRFRGGRGIGAGFLFPLRCAFRLVPALRHPAFSRSRTMAGLRSFRTSAWGGRRSALLPPFTLRRQGSLQEVFSFRQASDESADRIRRVENALHVAALSGRAAAFGGTRGRRGRTVSLDTGEIMSDEREGADAGKRAGARSGLCPQAVAADESPGKIAGGRK